MNILYIGYWGANEGLSQATINPHLKVLASFKGVDTIHYVSIERIGRSNYDLPELNKLVHHPLTADRFRNRFFNKLREFYFIPRQLVRLVDKERISLIICRSSLAGAIGHKVHKKRGVPFVVESFEPHADYMVEAGEWKKIGISNLLARKWEKSQIKDAQKIITVTQNYADQLVSKGLDSDKVRVCACGVNPKTFAYSQERGLRIRKRLGIPKDAMVGIYVGKFGGIYVSEIEAARIFLEFLSISPSNYIILLGSSIPIMLHQSGYSQRLFSQQVSHREVPEYLCASDFAFSLHSPTSSKRYVSPIKNGEYWANGLPIIMFDGVGDDSRMIKENPDRGLIMQEGSGEPIDFERVITISRTSNRQSLLLPNERSFSRTESLYSEILDSNSK